MDLGSLAPVDGPTVGPRRGPGPVLLFGVVVRDLRGVTLRLEPLEGPARLSSAEVGTPGPAEALNLPRGGEDDETSRSGEDGTHGTTVAPRLLPPSPPTSLSKSRAVDPMWVVRGGRR